jgi:aromatic-L-amino-acid/L-tryptophan decarboxylase
MTQDGRQDEPEGTTADAMIGEPQSDADATGFAPPLGDMSADEFRRHGRAVVDWIADYFERIEQLPVLTQVEPGELISKLPAAPPEAGESIEELIADVDRFIVPALTHWSHPAFFAYFATSTSAPGILGEMLSAAFDAKALLWRAAPAAKRSSRTRNSTIASPYASPSGTSAPPRCTSYACGSSYATRAND